MSTERAGVISPDANWGLSFTYEQGAEFSVGSVNSDNDVGVLFRIKPGVHYKLTDTRDSNASTSLRFGPQASHIMYPSGGDSYQGGTAIGGFAGLDFAFEGTIDLLGEKKLRASGFRIEVGCEGVLDGPQDGMTRGTVQLAVDLGTPWFNFGPVVGFSPAFKGGLFMGTSPMVGLSISSPIFEIDGPSEEKQYIEPSPEPPLGPDL